MERSASAATGRFSGAVADRQKMAAWRPFLVGSSYPTPAAALTGVQRLRVLHATMDATALTAYGWTDLIPKCTCEFLLDYEEDETGSSAEESTGRKKKKPWRYRWPDEVRDEILARLLKLNSERAEEEHLAGAQAAAAAGQNSTSKPRRGRKAKAVGGGDLFDDL